MFCLLSLSFLAKEGMHAAQILHLFGTKEPGTSEDKNERERMLVTHARAYLWLLNHQLKIISRLATFWGSLSLHTRPLLQSWGL